ncbi:MAG: GAF domain-containing protein [Anaerolineales bacterium]
MAEKPSGDHSSLFHRIGRLRWQAAFLALVLVLLHQWIEHAYLFFLPRWAHFWTQVVFYGLVGPTLAWLALTSLRRQVVETEQAERAVRRSRDELAEVNRRLEFLISVERRLAESDDEDELVTTMLELPRQVLPALGISLIRYDEEEKPAAVAHHGGLPPEEFSRWSAHLAAADSAQACESCSAKQASQKIPCPVLAGTPQDVQAQKVHCLTLNRGQREFGTLIIFLADDQHPTLEERGLLQAMAGSMSLALESQLLRAKEMETLYHFREVHHLEGLERQLSEVVASTVRALELEGGAACLVESDGSLRSGALVTEQDAPNQDFLSGMATTVRQSSSPMLAADLDLDSREAHGVCSLVVSPLHKEENGWGAYSSGPASPPLFRRARCGSSNPSPPRHPC